MCFKIVKGWLGDGREIIYRSQKGGEVYCDLTAPEDKLPQIRINSTESGSVGKRLMFYAPSSQDPHADHINKSNEIYFKIGIYKEEKTKQQHIFQSQAQTRGGAMTLEAQGVSETPNTYDTKSKFSYQYAFDIKIVLLNFEPEEEKLEKTFTIQNQIETRPLINHDKIDKLHHHLGQLKTQMGVFQNMMQKMNHKISEVEQEIESLKLKQNGYIY